MNKDEITENLIESNDNKQSEQKQPPRKKKTTRVILIVALILLVAGGGVGGYYYYNESQYTKNLDLGQKYLDEGDYDNAIIAFEDAIKISDKKEPAYEGLARAALNSGDSQKAKDAYTHLYDMTGNEKYNYLADLTDVGNTSNNLNNSGIVAEYGDDTYLAEQSGENGATIWAIGDGGAVPLNSFSMSDKGLNNFFLLNAVENRLVYQSGDYLYSTNLQTGNSTEGDKTVGPTNASQCASLQYYKGKFFYSKPTTYNNPLIKNFYCCDVDGENEQDLCPRTGNYDKFTIVNDSVYLDQTSASGDSSVIYKLATDGTPGMTEAFRVSDGYPFMFITHDNKIYYNIYYFPEENWNDTESYKDNTKTFLSEIRVFDTESGKEETALDMGKPIESFNIFGDTMYYVSGGTLYSKPLEGGSETTIGQIEDAPAGENSYGVNRTTINFTSTKAYVTSSNCVSAFQTIDRNTIYYTFSLDDPSDFEKLNLIFLKNGGNDGVNSGVTDEMKAAYREQVENDYNAMKSKNPSAADYEGLYSVFDVDQDGTPELIVKQGSYEAEYMYNYYTYKDGKVVQLGQTPGGHSGLYSDNGIYEGKLIREDAHMGSYSFSEVSIEDGKVTEKVIDQGQTDGEYPDHGYILLPAAYGNNLSLLK